MKIDIVIPWVDGNDPVLNARRAQYGGKAELSRPDAGGSTRYADLGEIHFCIRSINKFAPFINRIFIVTDGQDPHVESRIPVEIVDHKVIFRDHSGYLPVFSSTSIETLIWNIPDLSEHFLLLNDDFVLTREVSPSDFFTEDGKVRCYARKCLTPWSEFLYALSVLKYGYRRSTFKKALIKGSRMGGMRLHFFYLVHTPRPLLKSVFQDYYAAHPEEIDNNVQYRFRALGRYQVQALHYALLSRRGDMVLSDPSKSLMFIQHWNGPDYLSRKFARAEASPSVKFACFNSLDQATPQEREVVLAWIEKILA